MCRVVDMTDVSMPNQNRRVVVARTARQIARLGSGTEAESVTMLPRILVQGDALSTPEKFSVQVATRFCKAPLHAFHFLSVVYVIHFVTHAPQGEIPAALRPKLFELFLAGA